MSRRYPTGDAVRCDRCRAVRFDGAVGSVHDRCGGVYRDHHRLMIDDADAEPTFAWLTRPAREVQP